MIRVGQTWLVQYRYNGTLGATVAPDLHVNGVASGATVTLTTSTAGIIVASVSLAGLAVEDRIQFVGGSAVIDNVTQSLTSAEARIEAESGDVRKINGSVEAAAGIEAAGERYLDFGNFNANVKSWNDESPAPSFMLASSYAAPPTASANATAVRSELATELGRIDVAVSTRSTFASGGSVNVTQWGGGSLPTSFDASNFVAAPSVSDIKAELFSTASLSNKINVTASGHVEADVTAWGGDIDPPQAPSASEVWSNPTRTLTGEIEVDIDTQAVAEDVWTYGTRTLTSGVAVTTPAQQFGSRTLVAGDDYGTGARSFIATLGSGAEWPSDLSDYTWDIYIAKSVENEVTTSPASVDGSVAIIHAHGANRSVRVTIDGADTEDCTGLYDYAIRGVDGGVTWTIETGVIRFVKQV